MIEADHWEIYRLDDDRLDTFGARGWAMVASSRAICVEQMDLHYPADVYGLRQAPSCDCCGAINDIQRRDVRIIKENRLGRIVRCAKHLDRNPCAVDGCSRTTAAHHGYLDNRLWLCGEHWKIACPPRSAARRVYHRIFRLHVKRDGKDAPWSPDLDHRFWRIWGAIIRRARSATAGDIDMDEINKMFGWDQ